MVLLMQALSKIGAALWHNPGSVAAYDYGHQKGWQKRRWRR